MLYRTVGLSGQFEAAGVQANVMPQVGPSTLVALAAPAKAGLKLQEPVAVALTAPLRTSAWQRPEAAVAGP